MIRACRYASPPCGPLPSRPNDSRRPYPATSPLIRLPPVRSGVMLHAIVADFNLLPHGERYCLAGLPAGRGRVDPPGQYDAALPAGAQRTSTCPERSEPLNLVLSTAVRDVTRVSRNRSTTNEETPLLAFLGGSRGLCTPNVTTECASDAPMSRAQARCPNHPDDQMSKKRRESTVRSWVVGSENDCLHARSEREACQPGPVADIAGASSFEPPRSLVSARHRIRFRHDNGHLCGTE